ncbi:MAG: hypothetical protein Q8S01_09300, partial [Ignavibacteria bacterium]|nr:hypothetical protein [Ignavibacteria bacterium]
GLWGERYCLINLHRIIAAGKYELQVYYTPPDLQTETTKVALQISNPEGDEKIVYDSFVNLSKGFHGEVEYAEELRLLHEAHPNSAYTPKILASLEAMYSVGLNNHLKATAVAEELVEKYPWSIDSQGALEMFLKRLPSNEERIDYLKRLLPKSKNSPAQKVIELELKKEMEK